MTVQCGYVRLANGKQIHYRRLGCGPPLVMLHPSPQCSAALLPAMLAFSAHYTCFALDTPGYGLSDDIDLDTPDIGDYVAPLNEAIEQLGIDRFALYGSATGAHIAIAYGKEKPDRVGLIMLDANGHVDDDEKERILDGYMPDVSPQRNGAHLLTYWEMCRHLFVAFPWHSGAAGDRLHISVPSATFVHQIFLRYLRAGEKYSKAYRAAFDVENIECVRDLQVPTTMLRWEGSIVLQMADDMIALGLPGNVTVIEAGPTPENRYAEQLKVLQARYHDGSIAAPKHVNPARPDSYERTYWTVEETALHVRQNTSGRGRPVVIFHGAGESGSQALAVADSIVGNRPVFAVDLPGHAASTGTPGAETELSVEALSTPLVAALRAFGPSAFDLAGIGLGAAIALNVSRQFRVEQIVLIDPLAAGPDTNEINSVRTLAEFAPRRDGGHLLAAWSAVCNGEFFSPWFDQSQNAVRPGNANVEARHLHKRAADLLRLSFSFYDLSELQRNYHWFDEISESNANIMIGRSPRQSERDNAAWVTLGDVAPILELGNERASWLELLLPAS